MSVKTKIKNDLWRFNYIVPFTKKHLADGKGKIDLLCHIINTYRTIRPVKGKEHKRSVGDDIKMLLGQVKITLPEKGFVYFLDVSKTIAAPGNIISNFTIDYARLLRCSFNELAVSAAGESAPSDEYGKEARLVSDGVENLRVRILDAVKASRMPDRNKRISDFENMLSRPVSGFGEALQRVLFFNQIMWQTRHRLNGLGRMDLYLAEYYDRDIASGQLTEEAADRLLDDFFYKLGMYSSYKSDALEGDIGQVIVLGGLNPDGTYFSHLLSKKILLAQARSGRPDPKTLLRVSRKMPEDLLGTAISCLRARTGSPLFSNDDKIIPCLIEFGMPDEDAYSYCVSACWEPFIVGKSFDQNNMAVFDYSPAFDALMENIDDAACFEELVNKYMKENSRNFREFLGSLDDIKWAKDPLVSLLTDDCSRVRKDISDGAAYYSNYGITTVGAGNVADSLLNLKKLVYVDKKYTLRQLAEVRKRNFSGEDKLYCFCRGQKEYGCDSREAAELLNKLTGSLSEIAREYRNRFGGTVKFGLSSPAYNMLNRKTPADFSGRKAGMPYYPHISCAGAGYTEVVNFAGRLDYGGQRFNGNVVDFFVSPGLLEKNMAKFLLFMKAAIDQGFFQMQMNVMDSRTLVDAKKNPGKYPGLIVRVWGFSAYFNDLPESYKDLLIERALASEKSI